MSNDSKNKNVKVNSAISLPPFGWQKDKKLAMKNINYEKKTPIGKLATKTINLIKKK